MTITPFVDVKSEDILSAHISGIQHAVNKIETILNMKTTSATGHVLLAVTDQEDATLHNFIYEGTIRNWLANPVIKRNGTTVPASEYTISPAHGVVVFKDQQNANDVITADITYVSGGSQTIDDINAKFAFRMVNPPFIVPGAYITHSCVAPTVDTLAKINTDGTSPNSCGSKTMDLFPFFVSQQTTFDQMMIIYEKGLGATNVRMGIYTAVNGMPGTLLAQTAPTSVPTDPVLPAYTLLTAAFASGDLVLPAGMYYLARWQDGDASIRGLMYKDTISLGTSFGYPITGGSQLGNPPRTYGFGGFRATVDYGATGLPASPPAIGTGTADLKYLERSTYCSPWIRKKP